MLLPTVALPAEVSEGLNDISGDSIGLPNSFHPSDERTAAAFSGTGRGLPARATQIKSCPCSSTDLGRNRLSPAELVGAGGTFQL